MYTTCIHCHSDLGVNNSVEAFTVGRRLAFDTAKGRLWIICEVCRQWNLTPLEERWEAVEECERLYRGTVARFSTDHIGLARTPEGTDLIRIGKPLRPEFAAWRYGREFLHRRVAVEASMAMSAFVAFYDYLVAQLTGGEKQHVVTRVRGEGGLRLLLTRQDLNEVRLLKDSSKGGWILKVPHRSGPALKRWWLDYAGAARDETVLEGTRALHAAAKILARMNAFGGTERQIRGAVAFIEDVRSVERAFGAAASVPGYYPSTFGFDRDRTIVRTMRPELRLALEMAAHEQTEREACEGELEELEAAWREAEEIAAIADALLIPESIEDWIQQHRRTSSARRDQGNPPRGLEGDGA